MEPQKVLPGTKTVLPGTKKGSSKGSAMGTAEAPFFSLKGCYLEPKSGLCPAGMSELFPKHPSRVVQVGVCRQ